MADKPFPPFSPQHHPSSQPSTAAPSSEVVASSGESSARNFGQRSSDARDAMTEMAQRAQLISQEAGTKIATAMKDVISTAAGIAGFAVESARDLVQFMVRRGQMTQDEADKLIREAEQAHAKRSGRTSGTKASVSSSAATAPERAAKSEPEHEGGRRESNSKGAAPTKSAKKQAAKRESAPKKTSSKPASKKRR